MASTTRAASEERLSHVAGPTDRPLIEETVPAVLARTVAAHGAREAAVFRAQGVRWSYAELAAEVDRLAAGLLTLGLYKGDRVGIWSPNRHEWVLTQYATARLGLILVNINPAYRRAELEYALNAVECKALITARRFKSSDYLEMLRDLAPELESGAPGRLRAEVLPHLRIVVVLEDGPVPGAYTFPEVMGRGGAAQHARLDGIGAGLSPHDPINIQFTSGTTGTPKGATLSHYNIVNNALLTARAMALGERDRLCIPVPLYHCFGMVLGTLACVLSGATMVFPGEAFEPLEVLETAAGERCTALHGVPTMFIAMLEHPAFAGFDLRALRTGIMGGAPCPIEIMKRVVDEMHMAEVTIGYGMTETSPVSFQSATGDPLEKRVTTVGRVHPHVEAKVIDESGATVPVGVAGELCTRGYLVMSGYWGDAARTAEVIDAQGWMHTGDLAAIDRDGYCNIVGRVKDMLIRGGENVYPREIEEFLYRHPAIQEVQVFGVPDEKYGEEVCAWIVLQPGQSLGEAEIRAYCEGEIAHYKVPRHLRFVDELPMTVTGKPQKFKMREIMIEELGLAERRSA